MKPTTKLAFKKLLAVVALEFTPIVLIATAIPFALLPLTTLPDSDKLYRMFIVIGVAVGWYRIRDAAMDFVADVFFSEER